MSEDNTDPQIKSATPPSSATKPSWNERLNNALKPFFAIQEKYAVIALATWFVFVVALPCWEFYRDFEEGEGFVTFFIFGALSFLLLVCFLLDFQHVKNNSDRILFWKPWIAAFLSPIVLGISFIFVHQIKVTYDSDLQTAKDEFNLAIAETNANWNGEFDTLNNKYATVVSSDKDTIDADNEIIRDLRAYNAGLPHKESPAELMGFEVETNTIAVTNFFNKTNLVPNIRIEGNTINLQAPHDPMLDFMQMESIVSKLGSDNVHHIIIYYTSDSLMDMGWQIASMLYSKNIFAAMYTRPNPKPDFVKLNGIFVMSKGEVPPSINAGLLVLFQEMRQRPQYIRATKMDSTNIIIWLNP